MDVGKDGGEREREEDAKEGGALNDVRDVNDHATACTLEECDLGRGHHLS